MRLMLALAGCAACAAGTPAAAQVNASDADRALNSAAFIPASADLRLASTAYTGTPLDSASLLGVERATADGLIRWRNSEVSVPNRDGGVDTLRLSTGGAAVTPTGEVDLRAYDFTYTRGWAAILSGRSGDVGFDVRPRTALGVSSAGGTLGAGAMIRIGDVDDEDDGDDVEQQVLDRLMGMGLPMVDDGSRFGDRGRWYVFAAADGRAVGLNLLHNSDGWSRQGLTTDETVVVGEAQVGVGWRKGATQASLGLLHRKIKNVGGPGIEQHKLDDQAVAFTLSIKPGKD